MKEKIIERFTRYVKINTQSNEENLECPSTEGQWELAHLLVEELKQIGMENVTIDENAYVMATLPNNTEMELPTIGFLAHLDTATDFTGEGVNPQIVENYDGGDINLNKTGQITLSPKDFPELANYTGHTLITTDGTTLLGADNKAGIAEIITAMDYLIQNPDIPHGNIRVAFTPDEEIGRGPHKFNVAAFNADFAYTIDGGPLGELQYESFNAAAAKITIKGTNVHPGTAKGKMVHAIKLAMKIHGQLPEQQAPELTEEYEGFYHLLSLEGDVEQAKLYYIIRDHSREKFDQKKQYLKSVVEDVNNSYGDIVKVEMKDQYYNMAEKIEPVKHIVDLAYEAMEEAGVTPEVKPIRGGTDGSQLSFMGLPTPNIFTGGENFHGKYEYISVDNMLKAVNTIIKIAELQTKN
ncbi:peptidase T. Metallo peptidase. MEROPS family M20B [Gracilibacillus ureilyticus]|uniref:Peptidase T n=1 Tax=Gracilibacillus ureilyticus TaxID=531814 RepID=A0A1H9NK16_9BACI|nr:peptidase T [Gracilibacillus ureilyticus]SER36242.1 peptidase T. Metallo peptidase. MEROPS family M20B [Gracilibacillus ureilyticus]